MRITHALAAAALTAGLAAGACPSAQAAPVVVPSAHALQAFSPAAASKAAKARTKTTISGPSAVKVGDDITIKGKLTKKSGSTYKAYAKAKLELVLLDAADADTGEIVVTEKTDKKGKVTFVLATDAENAGESYDFLLAYEGGSKAKASESDVLTVTVGA